nr:PilZ domain-containing protein [Pseudodesulfovibrio sp.]
MFKNPFKVSVKQSSGKRIAYRAKISGLHVKVVGRPSVYSVSDLSPTGLGLSGSTGMREGDVFVLSLYLKGKRVATDLHAKVVRAKQMFTGLVFVNPDRRQMDALHALVLEEQKEQAEERKKIRYRFD